MNNSLIKSFTLCLILISSQVLSQATFQVTFHTPYNEYFHDLIELEDGSIIGIGNQRRDQGVPQNRGMMWKMTNNGDTISKSFCLQDTVYSFAKIEKAPNNQFRVFGNLRYPPDYSQWRCCVMLFDSNLNLLSKKIIENDTIKLIAINCLTRTPDNIFALVGICDFQFPFDPGIVKLDNDFNILDLKILDLNHGDPNFYGHFYDCFMSADNSQILSFSSDMTPETQGSNDLMIFDTSLNIKSIKTLPQAPYPVFGWFDNCINAKPISDSTFLIGGCYDKINAINNTSEQDIGFSEFDTTLSLVPVHCFGSVDTVDYGGFLGTFDFINPDSIFFAGTKRLIAVPWPQAPSWITVGAFNRSFNKYFIRYYGGDAHYNTMKMIKTAEGGIALCAHRYDYLTQNTEWDVTFLRLNSNGLITSQSPSKECFYKTSICYPNPGSEELVIELNENSAFLYIIDIMGQSCIEKWLTQGLNKVNTSSLKNGTYVVKLTSSDGTYETIKWIKN